MEQNDQNLNAKPLNTSQLRVGFWNLPAELRFQIYEEWAKQYNFSHYKNDPAIFRHLLKDPIFSLCHQVRSEAREVILEKIKLQTLAHVVSPSDLPVFPLIFFLGPLLYLTIKKQEIWQQPYGRRISMKDRRLAIPEKAGYVDRTAVRDNM